jgi:hypothetical protein
MPQRPKKITRARKGILASKHDDARQRLEADVVALGINTEGIAARDELLTQESGDP